MKYAIISENIVTDIIIWDSDVYTSFDHSATVVKIPNEIEVLSGDIYDNSNNTFIQTTKERTE